MCDDVGWETLCYWCGDGCTDVDIDIDVDVHVDVDGWL